MKKFLALLCVGMVMAMWSGCGLNPSTTTPTITINTIDSIAKPTTGSVTRNVTGKIEAGEAISAVSYSILTSADQLVSEAQIKVTGPANNNEKTLEFTGSSLVITVYNLAAPGNYKLHISVTAGSSVEASFDFKVTGTGTPVTLDSVTIGSLDNSTYGSSVNLDNGTVLLAADAIVAGSGVDIVATYSTYYSAFRVFNPYYAKDSSGITAFSTWASPNRTLFHKVSASFNSITTYEQIVALYNASLATADVLSCLAGDVLVVKTDLNAYVLVEITSFDANQTGTAKLKGKHD